jgi:hypothetical protein
MVPGAGMSSAHGFSIDELLFPIIVFCIYTVVPLSIGVKDWRSERWRVQ